jgi:TRAP-type C4-dicarboxylate transport system substrate-binding protein
MKTRRLRMWFAVVCLVTVVLLVGLAGACPEPAPPTTAPPTTAQKTTEPAPPTAPPEVIELKLAVSTPPMASPAAAATAWAEKFEEASGGRVKFTIYYMSSLFESEEVIRSVQAGVADISDIFLDAVPGIMPLNLGFELPFLGFPDPKTSTLIVREMLDKMPELLAEYQGLKVFYPTVFTETTAYVHTTDNLVKNAADLKGLKLEGGGNTAKWLDAMGATAIFIPYEDTYMSLERGLIEGHTGTFGWQEGAGVVELTPYHTIIGAKLMVSYAPFVMNPDKWNSLPPDIKKIFDDLDDFYTDLRISLELDAETRGLALTKDMGHTYYTLPPEEKKVWMDAAKPIHDEWIEETEAKGLPATRFYEEVTQLIAEYK